jgi:hypothetical protein
MNEHTNGQPSKVTTPKCDTFFWITISGGWCNFDIDREIRKCKGKRVQLVWEFFGTIWITYKFFKLTSSMTLDLFLFEQLIWTASSTTCFNSHWLPQRILNCHWLLLNCIGYFWTAIGYFWIAIGYFWAAIGYFWKLVSKLQTCCVQLGPYYRFCRMDCVIECCDYLSTEVFCVSSNVRIKPFSIINWIEKLVGVCWKRWIWVIRDNLRQLMYYKRKVVMYKNWIWIWIMYVDCDLYYI